MGASQMWKVGAQSHNGHLLGVWSQGVRAEGAGRKKTENAGRENIQAGIWQRGAKDHGTSQKSGTLRLDREDPVLMQAHRALMEVG